LGKKEKRFTGGKVWVLRGKNGIACGAEVPKEGVDHQGERKKKGGSGKKSLKTNRTQKRKLGPVCSNTRGENRWVETLGEKSENHARSTKGREKWSMPITQKKEARLLLTSWGRHRHRGGGTVPGVGKKRYKRASSVSSAKKTQETACGEGKSFRSFTRKGKTNERERPISLGELPGDKAAEALATQKIGEQKSGQEKKPSIRKRILHIRNALECGGTKFGGKKDSSAN